MVDAEPLGQAVMLELYQEHEDRLRDFLASKVSATEVEELLQKIWLGMLEALEKRRREAHLVGQDGLDKTIEAAAPIRNMRAFIFAIARNVVLNHYDEKAQAQTRQFDPDVDSVTSLEPSLSRALSVQHKADRARLALMSLPLGLHILFEVRYVYQYTVAELSKAFGIPEGTVNSRLRLARRRLQELMKEVPAAPTA